MYISRNIEEKILGYLNTPEIIALVGPRQCGKTTLLKHIHAGLSGPAMQFLKKELAVNFWRTKRQAEIDFIVNLPNNQRLAVEVKSAPRITDSVVEFQKKYPDIPLFLASLAPAEQAGSLFLGQL